MTEEHKTVADVIHHTAGMYARMSGLDSRLAAMAANVVSARAAHLRRPGVAIECEAAELAQRIGGGTVIADSTGIVAVVEADGPTWVSPALIEEVSTAMDYARMRWTGEVEP